MSSSQPDELSELLIALTDGDMNQRQFVHLQNLLSQDADAQTYFRQYMRLCALLEFERATAEGEQSELRGDGKGSSTFGISGFSGLESPLPNPPFPTLSTTNYPPPATPFVGSWAFSCMVSAVIMGVAMLGAWAYKITHYQHIAEAPSKSAPSDARPEMVFVGRITGMVDVKWSDDPHYLPPPGFAHVSLGRKYILDSGLLEITYDTGAKVILQGPCTYEVESTAGGYLALGKLTARVEKRGEGRGARGEDVPHYPLSTTHYPLFSVRTPTALVTDLGTEFGVEVDESGASAAHVFRGDVEVRVVAAEGKEGQTIRLRENESVRIETSPSGLGRTVLRGAADPTSFSSVRPGQLAQVARQRRLAPLRRWQAFSEELRKRDDLVAYYDFQRDGDNCALLPNRAATGRRFDGQVQGGDWVQGRFSGTSALRFGMPGSGVRLNIPVEFRQLTLAVWVNLDSLPTHTEFTSGLLMSDGWHENDQSQNCTGRIHWQIHYDGKMLFTRDNWKDDAISLPVFDNAEVCGHWRCLAVVCVCDPEASHVAFYLDGEHVGAADMPAAVHPTMAAKFGPVTIGAWNTAQAGGSQRWVHGAIDEMMIFRSALDAEEIHRMYESTKP